jgi:regulator of PEP synthase PpsR (kinase-PPPase family)
MAHQLPGVYIVSDSVGETAEMVVRAAASQFSSGLTQVRKATNITEPGTLVNVVQTAHEEGLIIAYTLVQADMASSLRRLAQKADVVCIDVLGPVIDVFKTYSDLKPYEQPGLQHKIDAQYLKRVEALEFAVRYDDGKDPRGVLLADIVLIGVSRTSKTPLSMYLANKGVKAANIPLVPEVKPPDELFSIPRGCVIGLVIHWEQLNQIRKERLRAMGVTGNTNYSDPARIFQELEYADQLMRRLKCAVIDVTNKAVEETASKILEIYNRRLSDEQH